MGGNALAVRLYRVPANLESLSAALGSPVARQALSRDLARIQQKGGSDLLHQSIFDIPCIPL